MRAAIASGDGPSRDELLAMILERVSPPPFRKAVGAVFEKLSNQDIKIVLMLLAGAAEQGALEMQKRVEAAAGKKGKSIAAAARAIPRPF